MRNDCPDYRKELLTFLLIKTAAVRRGEKPAELLRVPRCYRMAAPGEGREFCLRQREILRELRLNYRVLKRESHSALVLFYAPGRLEKRLGERPVHAFLYRNGYPAAQGIEAVLDRLADRFGEDGFPHEVGIFLGYPLKDVAGFLYRERLRPACRGDWQIFGNPEQSLRLMRRYRFWERFAARIVGECRDLESCLEQIAAAPVPAGAAAL